MEFTTNREALLAELNIFAGVVENRPSDPMSLFSNVIFSPSADGCELTASGGEIGLRSGIAADVHGDGNLSVPVSLLSAWLKEGLEESVSFEKTEKNWVRVRCGGNDTKIPGRVGEPPDLKALPETPLCTLGLGAFSTLLRAGSYAYPTAADTAVATAGAQIEVEKRDSGAFVRVVSSDHSRLAYSSAQIEPIGQAVTNGGEALEKQAFGVGMKAISELNLLARAGDANLRFFENENHLFFECGRRLLVASKLADRLPDYEHVIPRDNPIRVRASRPGLLSAAQSALPFATGDFNRAKLEIGEENIRISVVSVRGEAVSSVEVLEASGTPLTLHVNLVHLRDFARSFDCEVAAIECNTPDTAFLLRPEEENESLEHFCVGMPLV